MPERMILPSSGIGRAIQTLAFLCELAMLVLLAVGGAELPDATWARVALAVALPVAAIAVWSRWMAPTSGTRLPDPGRLIAQAALFLATGVLLATAGHRVWAITFAVFAIVVFAAGRKHEISTPPPPAG